MEKINLNDRTFIVKAKILESSIDDIEPIKKKYNCKTVLKQRENNVIVLVDEMLDADFQEISDVK